MAKKPKENNSENTEVTEEIEVEETEVEEIEEKPEPKPSRAKASSAKPINTMESIPPEPKREAQNLDLGPVLAEIKKIDDKVNNLVLKGESKPESKEKSMDLMDMLGDW